MSTQAPPTWSSNTTLPELAAWLRTKRRIVILTHVKPDGDAVGATSGTTTTPSTGAAALRERVARLTSTTTGRRWGQLSRPLVVLVLMVLFALLGAAFADSLWGRSHSAPPPDDARPPSVVLASTERALPRGIIDDIPDTTTARDQ